MKKWGKRRKFWVDFSGHRVAAVFAVINFIIISTIVLSLLLILLKSWVGGGKSGLTLVLREGGAAVRRCLPAGTQSHCFSTPCETLVEFQILSRWLVTLRHCLVL